MQNHLSRKKINIAIITCSLGYGGAERLILEMVKKFDRSIFNIHIITVKNGGKLQKHFEQQEIKLKIFNKKSKLGLKTIWQISRYLKKNKIQLVHTHLFAGDTWGRLAALLAGVPLIISTEHNINLDENRIKKNIKRILSFFTNKIIAVSDEVKKYQTAKEKISSNKIQVIYNGIDLEKFSFKPKINYAPALRLGILGRLTEQKGHDLAFKAVKQITDKDKLSVRLIIKGSGSEKSNLLKLANELKLNKQLEWQPADDKVNDFFQQIDILLIPSKWEGLGLVALEAMATGVPVIANNTGGLKNIITSGQNGLLFAYNDYHDLAEKIKLLNSDQKLADKLRLVGKKTVETNFNLNFMIKEYTDLYLKLFYEHSAGK